MNDIIKTLADLALQGWSEQDRIDLTIKYLNTTDPTSIDWTGIDKISDNESRYISVKLGYSVVMYTFEDSLPVGSVTITYKSILPGNLGKPIVPTGSDFAEKSWDSETGILVLENINELYPGSIGFLSLLYNLRARNLVSSETGILTDNNITAQVNVTIDDQVVYTNTAGPLNFAVEVDKDEFEIVKTASQSTGTVDNDPDKETPNNYYWVDFAVGIRATYHTRELEAGKIIDILPRDAILVSVKDFYTREVLYNSYDTPAASVDYIEYTPDPTGNTGGQITYLFDRNNPMLEDLNIAPIRLIVSVKFPLSAESTTQTNNAEINGYFEGEQAVYQTRDTAEASIVLEETGFSTGDGFYNYEFAKNAHGIPVNATSLAQMDWQLNGWEAYVYAIVKKTASAPVDIIVTDDLMYYSNENGLIQMEDSEYKFLNVGILRPVAGVATDYELYIRHVGAEDDDFVLHQSGTLTTDSYRTINFSNVLEPVEGFRVVFKGVTDPFPRREAVKAHMVLRKTDAYLTGPRAVDESSRFINFARLDVERDGDSVLMMDSEDYRNVMRGKEFTEQMIDMLESYDLATYGNYGIRENGVLRLILNSYAISVVKNPAQVRYDQAEGLYYASWSMVIQADWNDLVQNYNIVDMLPVGFSFRNMQINSLNSNYPINTSIETNDDHKGSGQQRVIIRVTSSGGQPDQIIRRLAITLSAYIDDVTSFTPGFVDTNYVGVVSKDVEYPAVDIQVGNMRSFAYRDDGSYFEEPNLQELWYDADSDRGANDYVWYESGTVTIPISPIAGRNGIEKYIKTDINPYYSRVGSLANLGSSMEYELRVNNSEEDMLDLIVYDTFPFEGDHFHQLSSGEPVPRGSEWSPIFNSLTMTVPDGNTYPVYCTTSQNPGPLGEDPSWTEISEFFATGHNPEDVKSIAIDFRGYRLPEGTSITINITMDVPADTALAGKVAVNTFYYTFSETTGMFKEGESNKVNVTIFMPVATIGDTLFLDNNNNSIFEPELQEIPIANAPVQLYFEVEQEDETTIVYEGYILKPVNNTTTDANGNYSFTVNESGVYFVKFENPDTTLYQMFSEKMENENPFFQISQVDQNGYTRAGLL